MCLHRAFGLLVMLKRADRPVSSALSRFDWTRRAFKRVCPFIKLEAKMKDQAERLITTCRVLISTFLSSAGELLSAQLIKDVQIA